MLLTVLLYSIFFCFWMPEILEFWILQMVLVWMLLIGMAPMMRFPFSFPLRNGLIVLVICLFCVNYFGSIRWLQDIRNDWYYQEAMKIGAEASGGDLVVVDNEWILKDFVRYYTAATVLATDEPSYSPQVRQQMEARTLASRHRVFIYRSGRLSRSY